MNDPEAKSDANVQKTSSDARYTVKDASVFYIRALEADNTEDATKWYKLYQEATNTRYTFKDASVFYTRAVETNSTEEAIKWYKLYQEAAEYEVKLTAQKDRTRNRVCFILLFFSMVVFLSGALGLSSLVREKISAQSDTSENQAIDNYLMRIGSFGMGAILVVFAPDLLPLLLKTFNTAKRVQVSLKPEGEGDHA